MFRRTKQLFLMATISGLTHRLFFRSLPLKKRPVGDIPRSNTVCIICKSTDNASENQAIPIGFFCMPTNRTTLTGIFRVNQFKSNSFFQRFVLRKELSRFEWPTMVSCSLLMMALCIPNTRQVFHDDTSGSNRLSKGDYSLTCEMTEFLRYGLFSSAESFKKTISGASSYTSNPCSCLTEPKATMVQTPTVNIQSLSCLGINGSQQVLLSTINTHDCSSCLCFRNFNFNCQNQIPNAIDQLQLGVRPVEQWQRFGFVRNGFAPKSQSFCFGAIEVSFPANRNALLFVDCQTPLTVGLHCSVSPDDLTEQRTSNLTWKFKSFSDGLVKFIGQYGGRRGFATVEYDLGKPVKCFKIVGSHFGVFGILRSNLEFVGSDGFHSYSSYKENGRNPLIGFCVPNLGTNVLVLGTVEFAEVDNNCNLLRTIGDWTAILPLG